MCSDVLIERGLGFERGTARVFTVPLLEIIVLGIL